MYSSLPRRAPEDGNGVAGYWFPDGNTICAQAYSMRRMARVFPDPDVFDPSRWVARTREVKHSFMPFVNGPGPEFCRPFDGYGPLFATIVVVTVDSLYRVAF
ncbi:hypothetical protein M440DRAFT_1430700 [Trichoderma longibrachiatum ATCC 18648]|uniref:Cytochrome P450 n=1 Tax=Trichoderma longibrachiatum ATCC 18648 TaxID=983965 RepID=A0A2T4C5Z4_TRILO|nr:hypothetical protein M440DRAFT_1430700 [Trichoderma longibrachiatum ATCC 18648]